MEQNISGFQISMKDFLFVKNLKARPELTEHFESLIFS